MPEWAAIFLEALRACPNVSAAAGAAGIERSTAYRAKHINPDFAVAWANAIDASLDRLEASTFRRAEEASDTLAIFLLKSHRPEQYGDRLKVEHSGEIQVDWGDPQGHDAPPPSGAGGGADAPGTLQGAGVRPEVG